MDIVYQDKRIVVAVKPAGVVSTDETGGMPDLLRQELQTACIRTVHRLDAPVAGLMVFARSVYAAGELSRQIREGEFEKEYLAVVRGTPAEPEGELTDLLGRDRATRMTFVAHGPGKGVQEARLRYRTLGASTNYTLVEVELLTGRHHQIRAQLSKIGCPIKGDLKYGARRSNPDGGISLHSRAIEFTHPVRREPVRITAPVPAGDNLWAFFARNASEPCAC